MKTQPIAKIVFIEVITKYEPVWDGMLKFLGDGSVANVGSTGRMLYLIARDELRMRATHYLMSDNSWKHGFYPVQGYYGRSYSSDGNSNELDPGKGVWWVRCACEHHKRLFSGEECPCELARKSKKPRKDAKKSRRRCMCFEKITLLDWAGSDSGCEV